jgi:excinuclease ABC subunit C
VPTEPTLPEDVAAWLTGLRGAAVDVRVPRRGDKRALMETVARNATQALALHKTRRAGDLTTRSQALQELQEALELTEAPLRIECYDVSNLQGTEVVASMVVFEDGLPRKAEYRRFAVRGAGGQDDVAAIHEVISRRFRRYLEEREQSGDLDLGDIGEHDLSGDSADTADIRGIDAEQPGPAGPIDPATGKPRKFAYPPQLVVVDGGAPQVAAAARAMAELGIDDVALCGLAKRLEEVWLPGSDHPVILPRASQGLYLLQRVRDEAHRFAIAYHRQRRSKSMTRSALDDVPGLGPARRQALLRHFGSLRNLKAAGVDEIAEVPGFGPATAAAVHAHLHGAAAAAPEGSRDEAVVAVNTATGELLDG